MNRLTLPTVSFSQVNATSFFDLQQDASLASSAKEICAVCADLASGYHYGILTCLGCKTFFRRTIANGQNFHCRFNNTCRINKDVRCACRSCRFRKCLEVGMDASGVQKRHVAFVHSRPSTSSSSDEASPLPKILRTETLIDCLVGWEQTQIDRRRALYHPPSGELSPRRNLHENAREEENKEDGRKTPSPTPDAPVQMHMAHTVDLNIVSRVDLQLMFEWAEFQKPFNQLTIGDKSVLLKDFTMQCLILEHGYYTVTQGHRNIWVFPNDTYLPRRLADLPAEYVEKLSKKRRQVQDQLFSPLFTRLIDEVAEPMHELQLSMAEWCALKALLFWNPDNIALSPEGKPIVEKVKCELLSGLFAHYAESATPQLATRYGNVLLLAPAVASIGLQAAENFQLLRFFGIANFDRCLEEFLFK
uniref:Uncharacterized protein n=1 Tax=Plectus sambesii TaxID=2011161 RepID=A0A914WT30_9BILA